MAIIGHSLGGIYARELACRFPNLVARVILLGSPVRDPLKSPSRFLRPFFAWWHRRCASSYARSTGGEKVEPSTDPPGVPETLIYSKADGVVQWQNCIESGPQVEAIEVRSSHCGLPYCAEVSEIIIDRLAQCCEQQQSVRAVGLVSNDRTYGEPSLSSIPVSERSKAA